MTAAAQLFAIFAFGIVVSGIVFIGIVRAREIGERARRMRASDDHRAP